MYWACSELSPLYNLESPLKKMNLNIQNMLSSSYIKIKKLVEDEESEFVDEDEDENEDEEDKEGETTVEVKFAESQLKKKKLSPGEASKETTRKHTATGGGGGGGGGVLAPLYCVVENCEADLRNCKKYHQRHKICEQHSKSPVVLVNGSKQRFCQQCSRFHELCEFDQTKRSCRQRLAGHNERRRKSSVEQKPNIN